MRPRASVLTPDPAAGLAGCRVLLVEDEYLIAGELQRELEGLGARVLGPVPSVEAALALIAAAPEIDAAVLDVNLRGEMVYPVADALQARDVPFILATGYERTAIAPRYAGVPHCEKPLDAAQLARTFLGRAQERRGS